MKTRTIHESLVNGQLRQMVDQILEYGEYDFWEDYSRDLMELYPDFPEARWKYFTDAVISMAKIKGR